MSDIDMLGVCILTTDLNNQDWINIKKHFTFNRSIEKRYVNLYLHSNGTLYYIYRGDNWNVPLISIQELRAMFNKIQFKLK